MISVVIFSAVILGLVGLTFQVAKHSTRATDDAYKLAALFSQMDRAMTLPYDSLLQHAGCDTTVNGGVSIVTCMSVTPFSNRGSNLSLSASTSTAGSTTDSLVFTRFRVRLPVPLR
jgi:Tfp pilus assembly protein PilV